MQETNFNIHNFFEISDKKIKLIDFRLITEDEKQFYQEKKDIRFNDIVQKLEIDKVYYSEYNFISNKKEYILGIQNK